MRVQTIFVAIALGVGSALLALNVFGLLVVAHPFGRNAERTMWLVPLLVIFSWAPFAALGGMLTRQAFAGHSLKGGVVAGFAALLTVVASTAYPASSRNLSEVAAIMWMHLLVPLALFPAFSCLLANRSSKRMPQSGAA
jgi:hypothetical protein